MNPFEKETGPLSKQEKEKWLKGEQAIEAAETAQEEVALVGGEISEEEQRKIDEGLKKAKRRDSTQYKSPDLGLGNQEKRAA